MPVTTTPRMHCAISVKISSFSFQTKTFLTHYSLENLEIRTGNHLSEGLIPNRQKAKFEREYAMHSGSCSNMHRVTSLGIGSI